MTDKKYTHGHHESVLRSHSWRTAQNSCAYLLPLLKPDMHILDVGCGPGTITANLAALVPNGHVTGIEVSSESVLESARAHAASQGVAANVTFELGDVLALAYPDATFDVVHAHQVLQHVSDPVRALREMARVAKPGGLVAARDVDFASFAWFPESEGMDLSHHTYRQLARANGGEPDAGRRLFSWALSAGFAREQIINTASTWCYSTPEDVAWWSSLWSDRVLHSGFASGAIERGLLDEDGLKTVSDAWKAWGSQPDAWFGLMHGEIVCTKPQAAHV